VGKQCQLTGKRTKSGKSYTFRGIPKKKKGIGLNTTGIVKRTFQPNLMKKRVFIPSEKRTVTLRLSANALRTMDKIGVEATIKQLRAKGEI
jgi:large subunit ribosomal protein L28